jgi:hypothetical protein
MDQLLNNLYRMQTPMAPEDGSEEAMLRGASCSEIEEEKRQYAAQTANDWLRTATKEAPYRRSGKRRR